MKTFLSLFACLLFGSLPAAVSGQTVEYTLPSTFDLVPDRLSVTFADTVSEAVAQEIVAGLGYEVVEAHFKPVVVTASADGVLSPTRRRALDALPLVLGVDVHPTPSASHPLVTIRFETTATPDAVRRALTAFPTLRVEAVEKWPGELVIAVAGREDEAAVEALEAHPAVRYVAYLAAN